MGDEQSESDEDVENDEAEEEDNDEVENDKAEQKGRSYSIIDV